MASTPKTTQFVGKESNDLTATSAVSTNTSKQKDVEIENVEKNIENNIKNNNKKFRFGLIVCGVCILLIMAVFMLSTRVLIKFSDKKDVSSVISIEDYILPNATLSVKMETNSTIKGTLIADNINYEFISISNDTVRYIKFMMIDKLYGFTINCSDNSVFIVTLFENDDNVITFQFDEENQLNGVDKELLQSFFSNIIGEHFVELSVELGGNGYLGTKSNPITLIHSFAKWIYGFGSDKGFVVNPEYQWYDLSEEFEKTNLVVAASKNAGFWVRNTDDVQTYSSSDKIERSHSNAISSRQLLYGCSLSNTCGNPCFGRCGTDCDCWSWICGDCSCWPLCKEHDYYCSCEGWSSFYCWNTAWFVYGCDYTDRY